MTTNEKETLELSTFIMLINLLLDRLSDVPPSSWAALGLVNKPLQCLVYNEGFWRKKFHQHFPHKPPAQASDNTLLLFKKGCQDDYAHLIDDEITLFILAKENEEGLKFLKDKQCYLKKDKNDYRVLDWLAIKGASETHHWLFNQKELQQKLECSDLEWAILANKKPYVYLLPLSLHELTLIVKLGRLNWIEFLNANNKLTQAAINFLLDSAVQNRQLTIFQFLIVLTGINRPSIGAIDKALKTAAAKGDLEIVRLLLNDYNKPSQEAVGVALRNAALNGNLAVVQFFTFLTSNEPSQDAIILALDAAAQQEQLAIIEVLMTLRGDNKPPQWFIDLVFRNAVTKEQLTVVQCLTASTNENEVSQEAIDWALKTATRNGHGAMVQYLTDLTSSKSINLHCFSMS